jgi:hypothetical protein
MSNLATVLEMPSAASVAEPSARRFQECDSKIRDFLRRAVKVLGREAVAARISELLDLRISVHVLNSWIAPGKRSAKFPLAYLDAFCKATGSDDLRRFALGVEREKLFDLWECLVTELNAPAQRRLLKTRKKRARP